MSTLPRRNDGWLSRDDRFTLEQRLASMWPVRYFVRGPIVRVIDGHYTDLAPLPDPAAEKQSPPPRGITDRLGDELLLRIFRIVLRATLDDFSFVPHDPEALPVPEVVSFNLDRVRAPFMLAGVCRFWRTLALRTGSLWTYIAVPPMRYTPTNMPEEWQYFIRRALRLFSIRWCKLLSLQLERSGNASLEVRVPHFDTCLLSVSMTPREFTLHQRAFRILAPHLTKVRLLHMAPYGGRVADVWRLLGCRPTQGGGMEVQAPMLHTIFIQVEDTDTSELGQVVQIAAPNLRICVMPNIEDLRLELSPGGLRNIVVLHAHCRFVCDVITGAADPSQSSFVVAELQSLAVSSFTWRRDLSILVDTLRRADLPRLRSARIDDLNNSPTTPVISTFIESLRPNARSLERLEIHLPSGTLTMEHAQLITSRLLFLKTVTILSGTTIEGAFLWGMYRGNEHIRVRLIDVTVLSPAGLGMQGMLTVASVVGDPLGSARVFVNVKAWRTHGSLMGGIKQVIDDATVCYVEEAIFAWE